MGLTGCIRVAAGCVLNLNSAALASASASASATTTTTTTTTTASNTSVGSILARRRVLFVVLRRRVGGGRRRVRRRRTTSGGCTKLLNATLLTSETTSEHVMAPRVVGDQARRDFCDQGQRDHEGSNRNLHFFFACLDGQTRHFWEDIKTGILVRLGLLENG